MWQKLFWLAVAGACGSMARYGLGGLVQGGVRSGFPWGTLVVNIVGCLAFGFVWVLAQDKLTISGELRTVILVGFLGSFTTFSAFIFETEQMLERAEWLMAGANMLLGLIAGLAAYLLGAWLARLI